jgi:hypothetical protein
MIVIGLMEGVIYKYKKDGTGRNQLGKTLMIVRDMIKNGDGLKIKYQRKEEIKEYDEELIEKYNVIFGNKKVEKKVKVNTQPKFQKKIFLKDEKFITLINNSKKNIEKETSSFISVKGKGTSDEEKKNKIIEDLHVLITSKDENSLNFAFEYISKFISNN